ncbi:MAG: tetratricopeptide repeat protein [Lachnospiraceae bacterium]|nr:tetratricopeptide repeat protein [Lachnospiraceae bacterium]
MTIDESFRILNIEKIKDTELILKAYRSKLVNVHPEEDPEGFKQLREAYELALSFSNQPDENENDEINIDKLDEFERLVYDAKLIYDDYARRNDVSAWEDLLNNPIFIDLDSSDKAREVMLAMFLDRFYLSHEVWNAINNVLTIDKDLEYLKELFPENFLQYIIRHAEYDDFIDYRFLVKKDEHQFLEEEAFNYNNVPSLKSDADFDTREDIYLSKTFEIKYQVDQLINNDEISFDEKVKNALSYFKFLDEHEFWHPIESVEKMRFLSFTDKKQEACNMAKQILFNNAIEDMDYGNAEAALVLLRSDDSLSDDDVSFIESMADEILERLPNYLSARLVKSLILYRDKNYKDASEYVVDTINNNGEDDVSLSILADINKELIADYEERLANDPDNSTDRITLARYLCQLDRWEDAINALDGYSVDEANTPDYHWFLGRALFEIDKFEESIPHLRRWNQMLDDIKEASKDSNFDDLDTLTQHRLNRCNYGYAILGRALTATANYTEAEEVYDTLISFSEEPAHIIPAVLDKALMYSESKNYEHAIELLDQIISKYGPIAPIVQIHQDIAYKMSSPQLVIDDFYIIVNDLPSSFRPYYLAIKTYLLYHHFTEAKEVLEMIKNQDFDPVACDFIEAILMLHNISNADEAKETLDFLLDIKDRADKEYDKNPNEMLIGISDIYLEIASLANRMNKNGDSTTVDVASLAKKALKLSEKDWDNFVRCQYLLTEIYGYSMNSGDLIKLISNGEEPTDNEYFIVGSHYADEKDYRQAIPILIRALELNPKHNEAHNKLSHMYIERYNDYEDSQDIENAIKEADLQLNNRDTSYYYVERGILYSDMSKYEKAVLDYEVAISKSPNNIYAYNGLGLSLTGLKKYDKAEETLLKAIDMLAEEDTISIPYENIIKLYEMTNQLDKALNYQEKMISRFGDNAIDSIQLGILSVKAMKYEQAFAIYNHCFEMLNKHKRLYPNSYWAINQIIQIHIKIIDLSYISNQNDAYIEKKMTNFINYLETNSIRLHPKNKTAFNLFKTGKSAFTAKEPVLSSDYWSIYAEFYHNIASFALFTLRDYKTALLYYHRENQYRDCEMSSATINEMIDSANVKLSISYCYACLKDKVTAKKYADEALSIYLYYKSDTMFLANESVRTLRLIKLAQANFLAGNDNYIQYLDMINSECKVCNHCHTAICYEEYLIRARICELESEYSKAKDYYQKAFDMSKDDCEAYLGVIRCSQFV